MSRLVFESPSAAARLHRAAAWVSARQEPKVLLVSASLSAASELARLALLQTSSAKVHAASLGWQRTTLGMLAVTLARRKLAQLGLAPASPLALEALAARLVHDHAEALGRFAILRDRPGLPRALARTLGELRLAKLSDAGDPDLTRLLRAFETALRAAKLADRARIFELATDEVPNVPDNALACLDVPLRTNAEYTFVTALAERASGALSAVPSGDPRSLERFARAFAVEPELDRSGTNTAPDLARLQAGLFDDVVAPLPASHDETLAILAAPGESRECVEIARRILAEAASGTPFDRMAIVLRTPAYGVHVAEALRRGKIPGFFAHGTKRPDPSGRAFLALLACAAEHLSAQRFAEYLSLGEVPEERSDGSPPEAEERGDRVAAPEDEILAGLLGGSASEARRDQHEDEPLEHAEVLAEEDQAVAFGTLRTPRHWERLIVEASVIGQASRWKRRLGGLREKLTSDALAYENKGEASLAEVARRELAALESLQRFALPLIDELDSLPARGTWSDWVGKLSAIASRALRHPERVFSILSELEPMGDIGDVTLSEVRAVLEPRLSELRAPETGRRYGRVFVATTEEIRGHAFDVVFVPGLAEKIFPQKVLADPLLVDSVRRTLSPDLPTNDDRSADERLALRLAMGAATRRVVVSYPRVDVEQARPRTPSFYGLEILRVAEGKLRDFEYLAAKASAETGARLGWPAPRVREEAIDEAEYDLALLRSVLDRPESEVNGDGRYLVDAKDANPHLARALRFRWMRWDPKELRSADGLVRPSPEALSAIREHATDKRSYSPTALQNFAACPYRFLLSAVHKLAPRQEPEAMEHLDALTRGSLVHEVLYRLLMRLRDEGLLPVTEATLETARARLDPILESVAAEYHDRLAPAIERVWQDAIVGIGADLREWLFRMTKDPDWTPAHFELSFGLKDPRAQDEKSIDEPAKLDVGLFLRGSIDLVERHRDGMLRATDYKTGKVRAKKGETVIGGGEILQPVLYALTLEKLFADAHVDGGVLYYCTSAGGFEKVRVPLDERARSSAKLVAKTVGDAVSHGFFPAAPAIERKGLSACTWCDFRPVCGPYEETRIRKKPQGPLRPLVALRKLP
jgi:ATP-dependent helicase/nuclease subunit B